MPPVEPNPRANATMRRGVSQTLIGVLALLVLGAILLIYFRVNPLKPDDSGLRPEVTNAIALCGAGLGQSLTAGLQAAITNNKGNVSAAVNQEVASMTTFSDNPEGTRKQLQYLGCVERQVGLMQQLQQSQQECSAREPCIDIVRVGDFSSSKCEKGQRTDVATIFSSIQVTPVPPAGTPFVATASVNGGASVEVYATDNGKEYKVEPVSPPCKDCKIQNYSFNLPISPGGVATYRYVYKDGHAADKDEGLSFETMYKVRSVLAKAIMPTGVEPTRLRVDPSFGEKCLSTPSALVCRNFAGKEQRTKFHWLWDWNMWTACPKEPTSAAASATAISAPRGK